MIRYLLPTFLLGLAFAATTCAVPSVAGRQGGWVEVADGLEVVRIDGQGFACAVVRGTKGMSAGAPSIHCNYQGGRLVGGPSGPWRIVE